MGLDHAETPGASETDMLGQDLCHCSQMQSGRRTWTIIPVAVGASMTGGSVYRAQLCAASNSHGEHTHFAYPPIFGFMVSRVR